MEQLPLYAYLHPLWQLVAFAVGLLLAAGSLKNLDRDNLSVRKHKRLGRLFVVLVLAGAAFGKLAAAALPKGMVTMPGHRFLAVLIVALVILGTVFGIQGERVRFRRKTNMMRMHPWLIVLAVALTFAQALGGLRALKILKF